MTDVFLNLIRSTLGSKIEPNTAQALSQSEAECERWAKKIGIRQRPLVADDEYTSELAIRATRTLLHDGGIDSADVDTLIICTQTPDVLMPGVSSSVHGQLAFPKQCYAMDINQGCAGFIYGTQLIRALITSGVSRRAVLVNADCYSRLIRPGDLTTRVLFGDAAASSIYSTEPRGLRVVYSRCYSNGLGHDQFIARNSAVRPDATYEKGIYMDGPGILGFALQAVPEAIEQALSDTGLDREEIRLFAFHQANSFVIGKLIQKLRLRTDQVPQNCLDLGNTVSASIPLLLQEQMEQLSPGDKVMAVGFGVGLSWGVLLLEYVG